MVDAFERDRLVGQDRRHRVGCFHDVGKAEHDQRPLLQHRQQLEFGVEHGHERRFAADQKTRDIEVVLGKERVEVVARDATRDVRIATADLVGVFVTELGRAADRSEIVDPSRPRGSQ